MSHSAALSAAVAALLMLLLFTPDAVGVTEDKPAGLFDHLVKYRAGGVIRVQAAPLASLPADDSLRQSWEQVATDRGEGWRVWLDARSGLPTLATSRGIPWYASRRSGPSSGAAIDLDDLAVLAEEFVRSRPSVLGRWDDQIVLDSEGSGRRGADVWVVRFRQVVDGVPVEGATYDFNVSHGRLVAFGARRWAPVRVSTSPGLTSTEARAQLDAYVRASDDDGVVDLADPELLLVPVAADPSSGGAWRGSRGEGYAHRLIWRYRFTDFGAIATWTGEVDAHTGEIVTFYDDTRYERIKGSANPISDDGFCDTGGCPEPGYPMPFADYTEDGGNVQYAGQHGLYACGSPGSTIETTLDGQYFRIDDLCGAVTETTTCDDELDMGVSVDINCGAAPGASPGNTDAARSAYYSLNTVARKARFWISGNAWLDNGGVVCRTNVNNTCNASWGGNTINMFRAGNGCGNTAQIQGVVTHEWGHGFDQNDGGGFDNSSEAYADVVAIFESRSSCVGRGFRGVRTCGGFGDSCLTCTGVREMDWDARQAHTPATPSGFLATRCSSGSGPCGKAVHCESHVPSESIFDLATRDLPAMGIDPDTAWQLAERLWYQSRPGSGGPIYNCALPDADSCSVGSWYHQLRVQDDDDGDLTNGTPHAAAIFAAFDRHDIACGTADDPENQNASSCTPLDSPAMWFTIETNAVLVSWDAVDGAAAYRVYRNENGCDRGQFPVAEVDGATTSFLDDGLANGVPVFYRVQAIGANAACESPVSACVEAAPQPLAGSVRFDRQIYGCSHEIVLEVTDANHPTTSVAVEIRSDTEATPEVVVLNETPEGSARFIGSVFTTSGSAGADGLLTITGGDAITVEYVDQDDGEGGIGIVQQAVANSDCAPPRISGVRDSGVTDARATILWSTDEAATSRVLIGETVPPSDERANWGSTTDHAVGLTGLRECTVYYYAVLSEDAAVNVAEDDNGGAYFHFETLVDTGTGPRPCHQGRIDVEVETVACESSVPIRVEDPDLNTDPAVADTVVLTVTSSSEAVPEPVVLTETGADTSVFTGSISTATGEPNVGDGLLQVASGDLVTATYADADDGTGGPRNSFDTADVDCDGPGHPSVWVSDVTDGSAVIHWTTSEPSTGRVDWGLSPALGNVLSSDTLATGHDVLVATVPECARIFFRVVSTDALGHSTVADADGSPFEFNAGTIPGTILRDGFESDTGWTLEGEWERGAPSGLGTSPGDPGSAFVGTGVLGHDLSGQGTWPGDFEPGTTESAISPPIDTSALTSVELRLRRWLSNSAGTVAYIEVTNASGDWNAVWNSPFVGGIIDPLWRLDTYDVSALAAGNPSFRIRFRQWSYNASAHHAGLNVDELVVRDSSLPLFGSCGGCGGAPTFAGIVSAVDDDPCADSGVTLAWSGAPSWGTGEGGSYVVYRDTTPGFMPSAANRIASGLSGTPWTDTAAPTGTPLYYVVRAENDETCSSGPGNGGMIDDNLVYATVVNHTAQPAPGDVGATLSVNGVNDAHARLTWAPTAGAAVYHVYSSSAPDNVLERIAQPVDPLYDDVGALGDYEDRYYLVRSADACGNESGD